MQYDETVNNARLDAIEATVGVSAQLRIFTGDKPANCAAADPAGKVVEMVLPVDWMEAAAGQQVLGAGLPWATVGIADGLAKSFRIYDNAFAGCRMQGTVTATGAGGDMTVADPNVANGQAVEVVTVQIVSGNQ